MRHIERVQDETAQASQEFVKRATGQFYTHPAVAGHLIGALLTRITHNLGENRIVRVCDPFCGDGRLISWLLTHWVNAKLPQVTWRIALWDLDKEAVRRGARAVSRYCRQVGIVAEVSTFVGDSFRFASEYKSKFDVVITNPPWELLKPDSRELECLPENIKQKYVSAMREYDEFISAQYPLSQPETKFAGWGTNLSRVGIDLCRRIGAAGGFLAAVMPASFLADAQSLALRRELLTTSTLHDVAYFPAEARLFGKADVSSTTLLLEMVNSNGVKPIFTRYNKNLEIESKGPIGLSREMLEELGFVIPVSFGAGAIELLHRLTRKMTSWESLEGSDRGSLWAGREVDETGSSRWLSNRGSAPLFIKGRMIDRYSICIQPSQRVGKPGWVPPPSVDYERVAWRDVSRPNQKRRVIATIIPPGIATGNSVGIGHFRDGHPVALRALLGIMNSVCFEFQLRSHLATGHASLSSLRKVRIPSREILESCCDLATWVDRALAGEAEASAWIEAIVARELYGLKEKELRLVLSLFPKIDESERERILFQYRQPGLAHSAV